MIIAPLLMNITLCLHSLLVTEEVCSLVDLMKRMMRKLILFMKPLTNEWMTEERKEGTKININRSQPNFKKGFIMKKFYKMVSMLISF